MCRWVIAVIFVTQWHTNFLQKMITIHEKRERIARGYINIVPVASEVKTDQDKVRAEYAWKSLVTDALELEFTDETRQNADRSTIRRVIDIINKKRGLTA